jgi:hypothetical protein
VVTLQLDDFTHLLVVDNVAIAGKLFFEDFEDLFRIQVLGETLNSGDSLATISLLNTNVYE